mmetsp:Transcript_71273/g.170248  ORF Transcript_71273/g.170248 Transcript_71273/m.170248 type:complete len:299 (-) Transcript_71273:667-1563(-)
MRLHLQLRVHTHDGHECSHLQPANQKFAACFTHEAARVTANHRMPSEHPFQHRAGRVAQPIPAGQDVTSPDRGAQPSHPRREGTVQGEESPFRMRFFKRLLLSYIPVVKGKVVMLAFIVPPKCHTGIDQGLHLPRVPISHCCIREVHMPAACISWIRWRVPCGGLAVLRQPALDVKLLQQLGVAHAWLADASDPHMISLQIVGQLVLWFWKQYIAEAKVLVVGLALTWCIAIVRLIGEPLKVHDNRIQGKLAITELLQRVFNVNPILPAPPAGHEAESIAGWHWGPASEGVQGLRPFS